MIEEPGPAQLVQHKPASDWVFFAGLTVLSGVYLVLILAMIIADLSFTTPGHLFRALASREIQYSIRLSLICCTFTTVMSLWVAVPTGYLLSRHRFPGKGWVVAILDIPIVLPPLVIGLSLLILFQTPPGRAMQRVIPITYAIPSILIAQFSVCCSFAVQTMLVTFNQINPRGEQVALTLGCNRSQAFWLIAMPESRRGMLAAATLVWARALGEFGPILIFSGATRLRTEVLPTTVFLELSVGNIEGAVAVSLIMIGASVTVLTLVRKPGVLRVTDRTLFS